MASRTHRRRRIQKSPKKAPVCEAAPRQNCGLIVLIVVLCACVYTAHLPILSAQASFIDDDQYLGNNVLVQNPGWTSAWRLLSEVFHPSTVEGYYQPVSMLSLMLDYALGGRPGDLRQFHRTSLLLHTLNTSLIACLLYMLFGNVWASFGVALLFGIHPMTVEPIAWISDRKTLIAAFFAMASLISYVRFARGGGYMFYACSLFAYMIGLMSKPTVICLPVLMLVLDYWPLRRQGRSLVGEKLPHFLLAGVMGIVAYVSQHTSVQGAGQGDVAGFQGLLTIVHNVIHYVTRILFPIGLPRYNPFPEPFIFTGRSTVLGLAGSSVFVLAIVVSLRRTRAVLAGMLFFVVALLPTCQIVRFTNVITSDKFAYFPAFGLLLILTSAARLLAKHKPGSRLVPRLPVLTAILLITATAEGILTRRCLSHWQDTAGLYEHLLMSRPDVPQLHHNLAAALAASGRTDEAIAHYQTALKIRPCEAKTHSNLGICLKAKGQLEDAIDHYQAAIQFDPDKAEFYTNLGSALHTKGQLNEAVVAYEKALALDPDLVQAHLNLALALERLGQDDKAIWHLDRILEILPNHADAIVLSADICAKKGFHADAIKGYEKALCIMPSAAEVHRKLGEVFLTQQRYEPALIQFNKAVQAYPQSVPWNLRLADVLFAAGRANECIDVYHRLLQDHSRDPALLCRLALIRAASPDKKILDLDEAIQCAKRACEITDHTHAGALDILGVVYAARGDFDNAIMSAQRAFEIAQAQQRTSLAEQISSRLQLYRNGRCYIINPARPEPGGQRAEDL